MEKIKILHCGDLHFDTPFSDLNRDFSEIRREDLRETFGRIVDMAKKQEVKLLLITGDLFDNSSITKTTLDYIRKKLEDIKDIRVFISPGNHDPYNEKSFYSIVQWPENVHVFKNNLEEITIEDLKLKVYGVGFSKAYERASLIKNFKDEFSIGQDFINIMVLHGDIAQNNGNNDYNPITYEDIGESKMDYIALGHRHSFSGVLKEKNTYYAYSGNPEGRGFDETGEKGIIMGYVSKNLVDLNFIPICKRKYAVKEVSVTDCDTYEEIIREIMKNIEDDHRKVNLYKIILKGEIHSDFIINKLVINEKLKGEFFYIKIIDDTNLKIDYDILAREFSLKGLYAKKMLEKIRECNDEKEKDKLINALKIGIRCLQDKEVLIDDN